MFVRAARLLLPATLLLGTASLVGCRHYIEYSDPPAVAAQPAPSEGRVFVKVSQARVRGKHVAVSTVVSNQSSKPLAIQRNDIGLQLADGSVVKGRGLRGRDDGPVVIEPGSSRRVNVSFLAPRGTDLMAAKLLLNGVRFGNGDPQDLGEVLFSKGKSTFGIGGPAVDAPDTEPAAAAADDAEPQGPATEDSSDEAEPPAADDGSWHVGH